MFLECHSEESPDIEYRLVAEELASHSRQQLLR
jgi:hypothetical protein